jgi:hypothetical protein
MTIKRNEFKVYSGSEIAQGFFGKKLGKGFGAYQAEF